MHNRSGTLEIISTRESQRLATVGAALLAATMALSLLLVGATAGAQTRSTPPAGTPTRTSAQPPLVGTLGPDAARALQALSASTRSNGGGVRQNGDDTRRSGEPVTNNNRPFGAVFIPYSVQDAPNYSRGGSTMAVQTLAPETVNAGGWYPTMQPPVWRAVPEEHPVQAWRTVDVDDVVCNAYGECGTVTTRVVARWVAAMRGYAFADRVGRVWRVE